MKEGTPMGLLLGCEEPTLINFGQSTYSFKLMFTGGASLGGWGSRTDKKTVSVLCQSDRHFLAFSDTTRNERHRIGSLKASTF